MIGDKIATDNVKTINVVIKAILVYGYCDSTLLQG